MKINAVYVAIVNTDALPWQIEVQFLKTNFLIMLINRCSFHISLYCVNGLYHEHSANRSNDCVQTD